MAVSMNTVLVIGNLTRDVELRRTQQGKPVAEISLAVNRKTGDHEEVCYMKVVTWGKTAENCQRYLVKGSCIFVEGYLKLTSWTDKNTGRKCYNMIVVAEKVQFMSSPRRDSGSGEKNGGHVYGREDIPGQQQSPSEHDLAKADGYQPQPESDDIPF